MLNKAKLTRGSLESIYELYSSITHVQGSFVVSAQSDQRFNTAGNWMIDVKGSEHVDIGQSSNIAVDKSRKVSAGENMEYYAGKSFIIACGDSSIELLESGEVIISGNYIKLQAKKIDLN